MPEYDKDRYSIVIEKPEDNVIFTTFGKNTRLELKNSLNIGKFVISLQKLDDSNHQTAFVSVYLDKDVAVVMAQDILYGKFLRDAQKGEGSITKVFTALGGSTRSEKIIAREFTISKGEKWIFKAQESPGKIVGNGLYTPTGEPALQQVSIGLSDETIKALALRIQHEDIAYRACQLSMLMKHE